MSRSGKVMIGGWVDEKIKDDFRVFCAVHKITMSTYIEAFIRSKLGDPEKLQQLEKTIKRKR